MRLVIPLFFLRILRFFAAITFLFFVVVPCVFCARCFRFCRFLVVRGSGVVQAIGQHYPSNHMKRTASAVWQGDLKTGKGSVSTQSGVLNKTQYSFSTRFEDGIGTNPEELIAAAHAGCFTMALSAFLGGAGFTAEELSTQATLTLEQVDGNWTITAVHLDLTGRVPGLDAAKFEEIADQAKAGCPVSRVLKANITLSKKFES